MKKWCFEIVEKKIMYSINSTGKIKIKKYVFKG